jgi:hypothetical protein
VVDRRFRWGVTKRCGGLFVAVKCILDDDRLSAAVFRHLMGVMAVAAMCGCSVLYSISCFR